MPRAIARQPSVSHTTCDALAAHCVVCEIPCAAPAFLSPSLVPHASAPAYLRHDRPLPDPNRPLALRAQLSFRTPQEMLTLARSLCDASDAASATRP